MLGAGVGIFFKFDIIRFFRFFRASEKAMTSEEAEAAGAREVQSVLELKAQKAVTIEETITPPFSGIRVRGSHHHSIICFLSMVPTVRAKPRDNDNDNRNKMCVMT